ncbi:hypothetical protein V8F33_011482 [Rhypophila sp. PSN 637]
MLTMQRHGSMNHGPLGMNIKSAMAANMGSSLFLFQGLHRISPYLLNEASSPTSPSSKSSSPSPSYFRFELQCTSCRRGECPICLDYNSKIRIGYSASSSTISGGSRRKMTKKQAASSSDGVQILKLDLCSYSRKVSLTREIVSCFIGLSYTEGDAAGSKPKEVNFDGLMGELESQGVGYSLVSKDEMEDLEDEIYQDEGRASLSWESRTQRLSGSYQRRDYVHVHGHGHSSYGSGSSSGYYRL